MTLQEAARKAWWQPGHPGWCIPWDYDSTAFMRSLTEAPNVAQPAPSPKMRISAPVPRTLQTSKSKRLEQKEWSCPAAALSRQMMPCANAACVPWTAAQTLA